MENTNIELIKISITDINQLQEISKQTFYESFKDSNSETNMQDFLENGFNEDKLKNEINNPDSEFHFAKVENKTAGYLKINFRNAQTEFKEEKGFEIERIYVLKEFLGKNVGQTLFNKALEIANDKKMEYIWLGVWEHNPRALKFYKKNGLVEYSSHIFKVGDDEQTDIIMKRTLIL